MSTFTLRSNDLGGNFTDEQLANIFGYNGGNVSPHLAWENAPEGTKSFAVICHDPDAPTPSGFWHWAVFDIPASVSELPSGAGNPEKNLLPEKSFMSEVDTGMAAYCGPCPPLGDFTHTYLFTVYALDVESLGITPQTPLAQASFMMVMQHELARASIVSYYKPKKS
ncbi:YbhB/YbcL family Raf kinase inhibitor-like protein [Pelagicoccus sp. NFK12]|uniref:YbhB/YbcL family Raf kinase inhibitor-like protein n=1 Tax=Pelagicoccus enzymogenes TaxID=2773457 RepID=A0A927IJY3_9BACT|nr:YbhB/YbcL family Raf kinase inhibitor-like protein [Pelagicoccus enzymogenes]MBD5782339.1 YbhB/YbcL family Raf kinase inhibitor-like protein [Pelagicoccus enzymogenes]MDQ8199255.1 YbhB/YbcL family Raf kinase inhibitor-like protein [Pelagicoccus enzymogenes]